MKEKFLLLLLIAIFSAGLTFAVESSSGQQNIPTTTGNVDNTGLNQDGQGTGQGAQLNTETQNLGENSELRMRQQYGDYYNENGVMMQLRDENGLKLKVNNVAAKSYLNISLEQDQNRTRLRTNLSNGKNAEIKIMPDTASERAIERLRLKNCMPENNCTIELKEVGQNEQVRAAYEVQAQKEAKVLGFIKTQMQVKAQIDAENGEVIRTNKPWWSFIAAE